MPVNANRLAIRNAWSASTQLANRSNYRRSRGTCSVFAPVSDKTSIEHRKIENRQPCVRTSEHGFQISARLTGGARCRKRPQLLRLLTFAAVTGGVDVVPEFCPMLSVTGMLAGSVPKAWSFTSEDGSITTLDPASTATLTLSAPESLVQAACQGVGIAQVGVHLAWDHLLSGSLKVLLHKSISRERTRW